MENKNSINFSDSLASEAYNQYIALLEQTDSQNRCRRCNHKLSDPTAAYGPYCAQLLGLTVSSIPSDSSESKMSIYGENGDVEHLDIFTNLAYNDEEAKNNEQSNDDERYIKPHTHLYYLDYTLDDIKNDPACLNNYIDSLGGINTSNRPGSDTKPDSKTPINTFQILYGAYTPDSDDKYATPNHNRYNDYDFDTVDALNWLIQTGGDVNFVLQLRDVQNAKDEKERDDTWGMRDFSANWQVYIINTFLEAADILNGFGKDVHIPKFYIGAAEARPETLLSGDGRAGIYEQVMSKLGSNKNVVAGAYYGESDYNPNKSNPLAQSVSELVHEKYGGQMLWIPFYDLGHMGTDQSTNEPVFIHGDDNVEGYLARAEAAANETHACEWGSRPIFDTIILQPGYFFYEDDKGLKQGDLTRLVNGINDLNRHTSSTLFGIELEYDMGVVTGRADPNYNLSRDEKKKRLLSCLEALDGLYSGTPLGIYSGGPNEQGYADPRHNENYHNINNHKAQDSYNSKNYGDGKKYSKFPNAYKGNFVYDLSDYIYRHFELGKDNYFNEIDNMSDKLRNFLGIY